MTILTWNVASVVRPTRPRQPRRHQVQYLMMSLLRPPRNLSLHWHYQQVIEMLLLPAVEFIATLLV